MNRTLNWSIGGAVAIVILGILFVMTAPARGPIFIAGDKPVTEDEIRQKLESDGWSNIQTTRDGQYIEATASKNGQSTKVDVDSQTGRLRHFGDADDDD